MATINSNQIQTEDERPEVERLRRRELELLLKANDVKFEPGTPATELRNLVLRKGVIPVSSASIDKAAEVEEAVEKLTTSEPAIDFSQMTYAELKEECGKRNISTTGAKKIALIKRLQDSFNNSR